MDENARKRKRDEGGGSDIEGVEPEKPLEGTKRASKKAKKQNIGEHKDDASVPSDQVKETTQATKSDDNAVQKVKAEKRRLKRERKKQKQEARAAKLEAKKAKKEQEQEAQTAGPESGSGEEVAANPLASDIDRVEMEDIATESHDQAPSTATPSPIPGSPALDAPTESGSSSISSIAPPTVPEEPQAKEPTVKAASPEPETETPVAAFSNTSTNDPKPVKATPEEFKIRLQARIEELRAARKADGLDGKPARNRQELLEARRQKEEQRKAHKKALRQQAKEEEERQKAEGLARGSPLLSPASFNARGSPRISPAIGSNSVTPTEPTNNFSFGRVSFGNGQQASVQLDDVLQIKNPKGPSDPRTALQAAEKKQAQLSSLDPTTRADREEKDMWLNAKKHAHGERVRDDTSLLKKTLKRKEKQKAKSTKEWSERLEAIKKAQAMKQKRREENLAKRKEEKGGKKGKGKKKEKPKVQARPGFEGSFGTRAPGSNGGRRK